MIRGIKVSEGALAPGDTCTLVVEADGELELMLHCLRREPPPPRLVPCGSIVVQPGKPAPIKADFVHFPHGSSGEIRIQAFDRSDGDVKTWVIPIVKP